MRIVDLAHRLGLVLEWLDKPTTPSRTVTEHKRSCMRLERQLQDSA